MRSRLSLTGLGRVSIKVNIIVMSKRLSECADSGCSSQFLHELSGIYGKLHSAQNSFLKFIPLFVRKYENRSLSQASRIAVSFPFVSGSLCSTEDGTLKCLIFRLYNKYIQEDRAYQTQALLNDKVYSRSKPNNLSVWRL